MWTANAYIWQPGTFTQIGGDRSAGGRNGKEESAKAVLFLQWLPEDSGKAPKCEPGLGPDVGSKHKTQQYEGDGQIWEMTVSKWG